MISKAKTQSQARSALRRRTARSMTAVAGVAVVGLIAAACGSSTPSGAGTSSTSSTTAASPAGTTGTSSAGSQVAADAVANAKIGSSILVNSSGMTLYTFSADTAGMSACTGGCATAWPPLTVPSGTTPKGGSGATGTFATITRSDGTLQVTWNGRPLYTFSGDSSAGATNGQNLTSDGGTWTVVTVGASTTPMTTTAPKTTTPAAPATTKAPSTTAPSGGYGY
jgi:predicted lipoprotein with Yx(FWY)xxD motif